MLRHTALALAVVLGAGLAYTYVNFPKIDAFATGRQAPRYDRQAALTAPPDVAEPLSFNAKLTSSDIPVAGGGVRNGACSGGLIDREWIITAGHCFHDVNNVRVGGVPPYRMTVTVGKTTDSGPGGQVAEVVDVRQSPVNDLVVAKLSVPIDGVTPLALPEGPPEVGAKVEFAGWGSTSATVVAPSDHLKRGRFAVEEVGKTTLQVRTIDPPTVENSPCPDDSGAPYFVLDEDGNGHLVAVENNGPDCPQAGPETTARVDVVVDWIGRQMG